MRDVEFDGCRQYWEALLVETLAVSWNNETPVFNGQFEYYISTYSLSNFIQRRPRPSFTIHLPMESRTYTTRLDISDSAISGARLGDLDLLARSENPSIIFERRATFLGKLESAEAEFRRKRWGNIGLRSEIERSQRIYGSQNKNRCPEDEGLLSRTS